MYIQNKSNAQEINMKSFTNTKKNIDMHYKITDIEKLVYDLNYPFLKNFELDNEIKAIAIACTKIKKLIETNNVSHV
jgi:hypothetical protein